MTYGGRRCISLRSACEDHTQNEKMQHYSITALHGLARCFTSSHAKSWVVPKGPMLLYGIVGVERLTTHRLSVMTAHFGAGCFAF